MKLARIHPLSNPVRNYAWGSHRAIAELLGRVAPSPEPEAELWLGAHPSAPSRVVTDAGEIPLDAFIARDPVAVLGGDAAQRFGESLPFLLKVLAAEQPLSLQAHPSGSQARAGFAREEAAGIPLDSERRSFRDPNPKPELICALTRFTALCGFRPIDELRAHLDALEVPELERCTAPLRERHEAGLEACYRALWSLAAPARQRVIASALVQAGTRSGAEWSWVQRLAKAWPDDLGVIAPLLLDLVVLAPGEALFLDAGCLHSYLEGVGVELMANSDNVLRGGLTRKHVDVPALLDTLAFRCAKAAPLQAARVSRSESRYATPAQEFTLSLLRPESGEPYVSPSVRSIEILLCTDGQGSIGPLEGAAPPLPVRRGATFLVPAAAAAYRLEGRCSVWKAAVPTSSSAV